MFEYSAAGLRRTGKVTGKVRETEKIFAADADNARARARHAYAMRRISR